MVDFNVGRVVPAILRGAAAKKGKLSPEGGVYPRDAIQELPDPDAQQAASGADDDRPGARDDEEAARAAVAIAWGKGGSPRPAVPLSAAPTAEVRARPNGVRGGAGVGDAPPAAASAASAGASDDDRGLTFEEVHKKYEQKIFNLILRFVGDREDAEDLTVETFVNAYRHWDRFRGEARIYTWLYQIAINNCKNRFKQRDRRREREPVSLDDAIETDSGELSREVADWRNAPEQLLMDKEFAARLRRAVDALRPEYREVFLLAEMEDMSYEDIARVTKLTVPAVKTRLHRARNMIRQRLEPYYRDL